MQLVWMQPFVLHSGHNVGNEVAMEDCALAAVVIQA